MQPWLVSDGKPWSPSSCGKPEPKNAQTFILTDGAEHWAVGTVENVSVQELGRLFTHPEAIPEFHGKRALNPDDAPSTGLWFKNGGWP